MPDDKKRYFRLTDRENRGTILKQIGRKFYQFKDSEWVRTGLWLRYFYPDADAPEFECYEEITEKEAVDLLGIR